MAMSAPSSCRILWSTQSGRAKSCARRTLRILRYRTSTAIAQAPGSSFDECVPPFLDLVAGTDSLFLLFVSTTGDGEHCDSISSTWKLLLQKSLPSNLLRGKRFAMFCLGDRAYGQQFCAAGRKLAARLLQLGMTQHAAIGYGDDGTPNGGVFADLDDWIDNVLLPNISKKSGTPTVSEYIEPNPYRIKLNREKLNNTRPLEAEWSKYNHDFASFFAQSAPINAYSYDSKSIHRVHTTENEKRKNLKGSSPMIGSVFANERITALDWEQDTRHISMRVVKSLDPNEGLNVEGIRTERLPYKAGDIATIMPFNSSEEVERFLAVLPKKLQEDADCLMEIEIERTSCNYGGYRKWPTHCTLRGWLTYCADIHALPEREDLRELGRYCSVANHPHGVDQREKLISLSETNESALYGDYILREKRSWSDVLLDFDSLRAQGSGLSIESLLLILPSIRPRHFSIASSPSAKLVGCREFEEYDRPGFTVELCVAVVKGSTPLGRNYHGLCSEFLARQVPSLGVSPRVLVWIQPGSFGRMPLEIDKVGQFKVPVLCVGAGTGIAPLRSLLLERNAVQELSGMGTKEPQRECNDNILIFGCRKRAADYYYQDEWRAMRNENRLRVLEAFSRDQEYKMYVQRVLCEADGRSLIATHILERGGAVYIAGGPQMARAVKEELVEALGQALPGGERQASLMLSKLQRAGKFSVEAWS